MKNPMPTLILTNDHLCSHTDGGKSTYVFHTSPIVVLPTSVELKPDPEVLERRADHVELDGK
jgi:hypothetical protein